LHSSRLRWVESLLRYKEKWWRDFSLM
jgi:hypothetical protein